MIIHPNLKPYIEKYKSLPTEPLSVTLTFDVPYTGHDPLHLDGLLSRAVVDEAMAGEPLPASDEPYGIPLPLYCSWQHPTSGLPLWLCTDFKPLDTDMVAPSFIHKRAFRPEFVKPKKGRLPSIQFGKGRHKEARIPLPHHSATRWQALCHGNGQEIARLLAHPELAIIGKKRVNGHGVVREWKIEPYSSVSLTDEDGNHLRPVPVSYLSADEVPITAVEKGWTPPYWLRTTWELCV